MAYGLYCTIPFTSLNGTSCQIQIWRDGYSGAVSTISPDNPSTRGYAAEDPFYFEEDSDHDLLKFIRVKTGYIRLIEKDNDSLSFLYPSREMQHYVRVYYGAYNSQQPLQNLVFTGYMRCQEFSNDWVAPPSVREFPVISPLGMIGTQRFDTYTPQLLTMGSILATIMTKLSMDYGQVIWPGGQEIFQGDYYGALYPWNGKIHSTAICPFNSQFDQLAATPELYAPQTLEWFLNGLCACKGWMLHDEPDALVFTKFDNNNKYYDSLTKTQLTTLPGYSTYVFLDKPDEQHREQVDDYFEIDGDDGQVSTAQPLRKLTIGVEKVGVYSKDAKPEYVNNWWNSVQQINDQYVNIFSAENVGPQMDSDVWASVPENAGLWPGGFSIIGIEDGHMTVGTPSPNWMVRYSSQWTNEKVLRARFYGPVTSMALIYLLLKQSVRVGPNYTDMKKPFDHIIHGDLVDFTYAVEIYVDGRLVVPETVTPEDKIDLINLGFRDVDGEIFRPFLSSDQYGRVINTIDIEIGSINMTKTVGTADGWLIEFGLQLIDPYDYEYRGREPKDKYIINGPDAGLDEKDITCGITDFARSENAFGDKDGLIKGTEPDYDMFKFMFTPQTFLEVPLSRKSVALPTNLYLPRWNYWKDNTYDWRVIAVNFHLRDDEYRLTLAHTDNMNDNPA